MRFPAVRTGLPGRVLATMVVGSVLLGAPLAAVAEDPVKQTRQELRETKEQIRARAAKMRALQRDLNRLATRIAETQDEIHHAEARQDKLTSKITVLQQRHADLQGQLDERTREAYILGPGTPILYLLTATSAGDAVSRVGFLDEMNRRDELLVDEVVLAEERLSEARAELQRIEWELEYARGRLAEDRAEIRRKMARAHDLYELLKDRKQEVLYRLSQIRPFAVCPVQGPHAISDSFGIWVERSKKRGGDHVHQGNDISAPAGTPIVAPFDGVAVTATNKIGGLAVKVFGDYGYVYNAHLSRFGKLGSVERGDVVGYVGSTGNALGPHDHFEWHPRNGAAADPYGFLMQVC
jgi:murein DD-endopeptidase MepM/ murein hydrolase activator NlpD